MVFGEGVILKFLKDGEFVPYGCARTVTLNLVADTIGKSTVGSGNWKEKEVAALDWNFSLEGMVFIDDPAGNFLAADIYRQWRSMTPVQIEFFMTDADSGGTIQAGGQALITNVSTNGAINSTSSFNVTGEGTGELWMLDFRIINVDPNTPPGAGKTTLTFSWNTVAGATAYTIRITDLTNGNIVDDTAGDPPRNEIVTSSHNYSFMLKPEPAGEFGDEIFWPDIEDANYIIDSDSIYVTDSDGVNILTQ